MLREVTVKIGLERIDTQEEVIVEVLLNNDVIELVISSEFAKKRLIEHMIKMNIYYQKYRERMKINMISGQKQSIILRILQLTCHNFEIDWRTEEVSREVQKTVEAEAEKTRVAETKRKREDNKNKESGRIIGDLK